MYDEERIRRIRQALRQTKLDAVVVSLPTDVLLLSGYWPITGTALAIATRDCTVVLAPEDEKVLAERGWADCVYVYQSGSLDKIQTVYGSIKEPLSRVFHELHLTGRIGYRRGPAAEGSSYAALHVFGSSIVDLLSDVCPQASLSTCDLFLERLRSIKTVDEIKAIHASCQIAETAFVNGAPQLQAGLKETEAAALFQSTLEIEGVGRCVRGGDPFMRAAGFVYCMAGPDAALARYAYAQSRANKIQRDDFVLVHCNSYADGYWTDITRTFCLGVADSRKQRLYCAVLAAREAALDAIRPGVPAADVDHAARRVLAGHSLDAYFPHATGHGVGFGPFNPDAFPRIHPKSQDVLEPGMVFNVEPALYFDGYGGLRHCDMVAVTDNGVELLTPFQSRLDELIRQGVRIDEQ